MDRPWLRWTILSSLMVSGIISGCAFYPEATERQEYAFDCDMFTKSLTLAVDELTPSSCGPMDSPGEVGLCFAGQLVGVPAITLVVSGSVVLVGNGVHWLEYHSTCDNGFVNQQLQALKEM